MSHSPLQIAACLQRLRREPPTLIGRERELAAVQGRLRARRPLFVSGPSGVGKSALLQATYSEWNADCGTRNPKFLLPGDDLPR